MRLRKLYYFFLFILCQTSVIFAQQSISLITEPKVTQGTSNRVFSEQKFGVKTFLFKASTATKWDTIASSGNPNQYFVDVGGLQNDVEYQYQVLFSGTSSNIVSSVQDNEAPVVTVSLPGNFVNQNSFQVPFSAYDLISKSVNRAYLFYRPKHNDTAPWRYITEKALDSSQVALDTSPLLDNLIFSVPDSLGDGAYEFYIAARDTAWSPLHRPDEVFSGAEGNAGIPVNTTTALKQIFVDTHAPVSDITTQLNKIIKNASVSISYSAKDSSLGHNGYSGSGISKVSLYYNYKEDPDGPYLEKDSFYTTKYFSTPLLAVSGSFNFTAGKNGYYEFYTITSDTAQNLENAGAPKTTGLPYLIIDTVPPTVDSLILKAEPGGSHPAKNGWTSSRDINFQAFGMIEPLKDNYASGLDSFFVAENQLFNKNRKAFKAITGTNSGSYNLSETPGEKSVFLFVADSANNNSIPVSDTITYDPSPPVISNFDIPFKITTQKNISVSLSVQDQFVLDSLFIWRDDSLVSSILLPENSTYSSDISLELSDELRWHVFKAQVRDKAGNLSVVSKDSVKYSQSVVLSDLNLSDLSSPADPYFAAESGYSDSSMVLVSLTYQNYLLKLQISEDPNFNSFLELTPPWNITKSGSTDTTISTEYAFSAGDGVKNIYVRGFGPQLSDVSNVLETSFIIDTVEPVLSGLSVYNVLSSGDTTFSYTKSRDVHVRISSQAKDLSKIVFWEDGQDSLLLNTFTPDTTYSLRSLDDGTIIFNARIRDRAGNWSAPIQTDVYLDRQKPIIDVLSFDHQFSSTFSVDINVDVKDDTSIFAVGALDKIRFSENVEFPANETQVFDLHSAIDFSGSFSINLIQTFSKHVVYAQVRDKAGNWSSIANATIEVVDVVQPVSLSLEDLTPATDQRDVAYSGWSNSDTVLATLTHRGVLKQILTAQDQDFSVKFKAFDQWTTLNDSTIQLNYSFGDMEGAAKLWVKLIGPNLSDTSAIISQEITIDKTSPSLLDFKVYKIAGSDTLFDFTNERTVTLQFISPDEPVTNALVWEASADTQFVDLNQFTVSYDFASDVNAGKSIFAAVRDSAGNWSLQNYTDSIIFDSVQPTLSKLFLSDLSVAGIDDSLLTDDLSIEVSVQASDLAPGKLFKLLIAQDAGMSQNVHEYLFNSSQIQLVNGLFTVTYQASKDYLAGKILQCWAAVEDSALNQSPVATDDITVTEKLEIAVRLYDLNDQNDSLYSGTAKVGLFVKEVSGVYEEVSFSESKTGLVNWQKVTSGQPFSTTYEFSPASTYFMGQLYVSARNSAGQSVLDSAQITIDRESPVVSSVLILATDPVNEEKFSNKKEVKVRVNLSDSGRLSKVYLSEDSTFSNFQVIDLLGSDVSTFQNEIDFQLSDQNGPKRVFVRIMDAAENISAINSDGIIADYDPFSQVTNHPNPFNPNMEATTIVVKTHDGAGFELNIYDLFGNHIRKIEVPAGKRYNQIRWDGKNGKGETVANGGYICVVKTSAKTVTRKIAVIK